MVKNLPAVQETQEAGVRPPGQEDPLGKEIATHSSMLAWQIPWTGEPGGLPSIRSQKSWTKLLNYTITVFHELQSLN